MNISKKWIRAGFCLIWLPLSVAMSCNTSPYPDGLYAEIQTPKGTVVCELDYKRAPLTVTNFVGLAEGTIGNQARGAGQHFYDGLTFHRVEPGFVIQGGDPNGDGNGGPGYQFPNEINPELTHDKAGTLAMANAGPNTNGSQFYITQSPQTRLDGRYSVFGHVIQGMDVVNQIQVGDRMEEVRIVRVGKDAKAFTADQTAFNKCLQDIQEKHNNANNNQQLTSQITPMDTGKYEYNEDGLYAEIQTIRGNIVIRLEFEKTPMTVANFVGLAEGTINNTAKKPGEHYYDGLKFHRVVPNFVIQGGDPQGNGQGGPGYKFADEFDETLRHDGPGVLSMANAGPGTNGSQFFITHNATPHLDNRHSVFGRVVHGMSVVNAIRQGDVMEKVIIKRIGKKAEKFESDQQAFETYQKELVSRQEKAKEKQKADFDKKIKGAKKKVQTTASGLQYTILEEGKGDQAAAGKVVSVHYTGYLEDGSKFDSSVDRGQPISFPLGQGKVIKGWDEGITLLKTGSKAIFFIPPSLAYGENGIPNVIPPGSTLIFEVELVSVN
ncbi:MAG: peptidylprolyl isomerase [Flavobacteriales bacterium]|nr:peptidylprolyl isomerase [Flavobacteriales bacterium]